MKYNIFDFNQEKVISLSKKTIDNGKDRIISLDVSDLLILLVISDFVNRKNIIKYTINDKTYFSVQYKVILDDLPILNIKKQALTDKINKMVYLGVIEKEIIKNQTGSYSVFRMGEEYEKIKYSCTDTQLQVRKYPTTSAKVVDYKPKDPSTNNYSTNTKEDTNVSKKDCDDSNLVSKQVDELYDMYPTKWPKRNVSLGKSFKCKDKLKKLIKQYGYEMLKFTISKECEEKYGKSYMSNFSTFLNNLPDYGYVKSESNEAIEVTDNKSNDININGVTYK